MVMNEKFLMRGSVKAFCTFFAKGSDCQAPRELANKANAVAALSMSTMPLYAVVSLWLLQQWVHKLQLLRA
jgi:hypothetical protein